MDERSPHYPLADIPERVFRISRSLDPREFTPWKYLDVSDPGRLDDPQREYRVLYYADSHLTAMIEVLAHALEPILTEPGMLAGIELDEAQRPPPDLAAAAREVLSDRWATTSSIEPATRFAALGEPRARRQLEADLAGNASVGGTPFNERIKIGDLTGSDPALARRASRIIFLADQGRFSGIALPSAERPNGTNYALFETGHETGLTRATVQPLEIIRAGELTQIMQKAIVLTLRARADFSQMPARRIRT